MDEELIVLELFSGIGGMHFALKESCVAGRIIAGVDINQLANETYTHNFPESKCLNNNIQKLKIKDFQMVNTIQMSPPCQPFTRNGNFKDVLDNRSDAFMSVCEIIKNGQLPNLKYILMENVMGFEKSKAREIFIDSLTSAGFHHQEFIVSPTSVGVPNTRNRYYCLARRSSPFAFASADILRTIFGVEQLVVPSIESIIDVNVEEKLYLLSDDLLQKRFQVLDICTIDSINSMCFTKSYSRYVEGTGSVFCPVTRKQLQERISEIEKNDGNLEMKRALKLRFFTPTEVARLMSFPADFSFPNSITDKQRYRLLGNSINVKVVSELVKLLKT